MLFKILEVVSVIRVRMWAGVFFCIVEFMFEERFRVLGLWVVLIMGFSVRKEVCILDGECG